MLDTDKIAPGGLKSNSTYSAKYKAQYVNGDEKIDLKVSGGVSKIKTSRRSVEIEMKNVQGVCGIHYCGHSGQRPGWRCEQNSQR